MISFVIQWVVDEMKVGREVEVGREVGQEGGRTTDS